MYVMDCQRSHSGRGGHGYRTQTDGRAAHGRRRPRGFRGLVAVRSSRTEVDKSMPTAGQCDRRRFIGRWAAHDYASLSPCAVFFSRVNSPPTVECNKYQLSQMDPRDALPHARRAVHRCGRSVSYTGQCGRLNVDCHNYCALSSTEYGRQFITPSFSTFEAQSLRQSYRRTCALLSGNTQFKKHSI